MPADTASLLEEMRRIFTGLYAAANTDQAFLAFEAVGIPVDAGMLKLSSSDTAFSPPVALESLSRLADQAPSAGGEFLSRGINTLDGTIELCLDGSQPVDADAMSSLGAAKLAAHAKFDLELGSVSGVPGDRFRPTYASPPDWYDPAASGNWTAYSASQQQGTTPPAPAPGAPPPVWRILSPAMRSALVRPEAAARPLEAAAAAAAAPAAAATPRVASLEFRSDLAVERPFVREVAARRDPAETSAAPAAAATTTAAAGPSQAAFAAPRERAAALTQAVAALSASTTPQPVHAESVEVSFAHCVVTLDRPWLPDTFLMTRDWYLAGYARGDISGGTGALDPGSMPLLPRAFVAVRDLKITASWLDEDLAAVPNAASFGPFYLLGSTFDAASGTLACPGIQIIGWFCAAFPVLPPVADPSLPVASPAVPAASAPSPSAPAPAAADSADVPSPTSPPPSSAS